ncbi:hypothetical protein T4D_5167 [Trichinella pseudospiralis]|uniref:Uncharacterized protein n=1 Tax=Trichinella pseudospiralis TaxID=6337 RepID=A0A0V1G0F4_TRIPS|nr:hypothetical protein T4D_99 [Trichinella pseudospiralis]KRY91705.1 hypothetical protein T4D_5167 [Trichinella pseudospiralis]
MFETKILKETRVRGLMIIRVKFSPPHATGRLMLASSNEGCFSTKLNDKYCAAAWNERLCDNGRAG